MKQDEPCNDLSSLLAASAYVLEGEYVCDECGVPVPVYGVMLVGPFDVVGDPPVDEDDDSAILRRPLELPATLAAVLTESSSGHFHPDFSRTIGQQYWMNHCRDCGAKIGDWFVHSPGEAFFPLNDADLALLKGRQVDGPLRFVAPELAASSWTSNWLRKTQISRS